MTEMEGQIVDVSGEIEEEIEPQEVNESLTAWAELFEKFVAITSRSKQDIDQTNVSGLLFIDGNHCDIGLIITPYFCDDQGQPELLIIDLACNDSQKEPNPGRCMAFAIWDDGVPDIAEAEGHFSNINGHPVSTLDVIKSAIKVVDNAAINLETTIIPDGMVFPLPKEILRPNRMN
jgi:hypothetical protein